MNLGIGYGNRHQRTEDKADLDTVIQYLQESVIQTPSNHPHRSRQFLNLGTGYYDRYQRTGERADLDIAISHLQDSIHQTPLDHLDRARWLLTLGNGYHERYTRIGDTKDLDAAIQHLQKSLDHAPSPTRDRLVAAISLLPIYATANSWKEAYGVAHTAMRLVPLLAPRFLQNADKQHLLAAIAGLDADSTAMALYAAEDPFHAVQLLELGRGVIGGSLNEMRIDVTAVVGNHPELGKEFIGLRDLLDSPESSESKTLLSSANRQSNSRYDAWIKMEKVLSNIRNQIGFENFLLAPRKEDIQISASYGPVVIINVSEYRCDAILVEQLQIRSLALPNLNMNELKEKAEKDNIGCLRTLQWLWDVVMNPILDALGFTEPPSDNEWPRVWWIPTGPLSKFPLHAAGRHTEGASETVLNRVISSYSSSIKAIIHGRQRPLSPSTSAQALLVAMEHTPGSSRLPFAAKEVAMLHGLFKSELFNAIEPGRRKKDVVSHLPQCKIFHFAGHRYTNKSDLSKSHLCLEDWENDPLMVASLLEMNIQKYSPFLAYLSACGTGQIRDEKFFDESIHMISAFQLAGFRHVIGTLWEVNDEICVNMARIMYQGLMDGDMTDDSVCRGLHNATKELRDRWMRMSAEARHGSRSVEQVGVSLPEHKTSVTNTRDGDQGDDRLPRDIVSWKDGNEETESLLWVPYVHFGV
jgi:hypothetical protein